ncbi:hypothetical protein AVEN_159718-1 [Araneus ventricosus]|uniref:Uncharacterized protein n=1 Tax=Araneus ventricosus TaxID=182803 RepID=A0A4Y2J9B5_ARAVE|nr:hypothetical protein AVEN_159718-1 [Araneus ventricosus]
MKGAGQLSLISTEGVVFEFQETDSIVAEVVKLADGSFGHGGPGRIWMFNCPLEATELMLSVNHCVFKRNGFQCRRQQVGRLGVLALLCILK